MSTPFVPPVASTTAPTFPQPSSTPFLAAQPESLVPTDAVQQPAPTQVQQPFPNTPFGSTSFPTPSPSSAPADQGQVTYGKLVLTPADVQAMNIAPTGDGTSFMVAGPATFFYKKYFRAVEGSRFAKAGGFSTWIYPLAKKNEVEVILSKIKSGEYPASNRDELNNEKKESRERKQKRIAEKSSSRPGPQMGAQSQGYPPAGFQQPYPQPYGYPPQQVPFGYPQQPGFGMPQTPFGYPQQTPFGYPSQPAFGHPQQKVKKFENRVEGDFQVMKIRIFRPLEGHNVVAKFNGMNYNGIVTRVNKAAGDVTLSAEIRFQDGAVATAVVCEGKWQVKGFSQDHTLFFNGH